MAETDETAPPLQVTEPASSPATDPVTKDSSKDAPVPPEPKPATSSATTTVTKDTPKSSHTIAKKPVEKLPIRAPSVQVSKPKAADASPPPYTQRQVYIAVMGKTGTGKTSFINQISEQNLTVGHGLRSCTQNIEFAHTTIDGDAVTFIDTPGFDDSKRDDGEILTLIGTWLKSAHNKNELLSGVIYLHSITDTRMALSGVRSLDTLKKMCGTENYGNIALVTTMWDTVNKKTGEQRERELTKTVEYWQTMIDDGATVFRHDGQKQTAIDIVKNLLPKKPIVLDIQTEMSSNEGIIGKTTAGSYIKEFLESRQAEYEARHKKYEAQILDLRDIITGLTTDRENTKKENEAMQVYMQRVADDLKLLMTRVDELVKRAKTEGTGKPQTTFMGKLLDMLNRMEKKPKQTPDG